MYEILEIYDIKDTVYKRDLSFETRNKIKRNHLDKTNKFGTRNASSEGNKCNGIDAVFEVDEAAEMSSNISNDGSTGPDEYERYDESDIAIGHSCKKMDGC